MQLTPFCFRHYDLSSRAGEVQLAAGAEINAHDKFDESAATLSLDLGRFDATVFLLEHGFSYKLAYLARNVKIIQVPKNTQAQRLKDQVILMLKERGISSE